MDKKFKLLIYIAGFALLILAAYAGYNYLSRNYNAPERIDLADPAITGKDTTPEPGSGRAPAGETALPTETPSADDETAEKIKAPDFTAIDYEGNEVTLYDYIGTPIVLNFWASWCPPCRDEMPHFNKVSQEYQDDELLFLMVDLTDGVSETEETGKRFIEENGYTFTVLFDLKQEAAMAYGIRSIPCTILIDRDGYIRGSAVGSISEETLRYGISLILEGATDQDN